MHVLIVLAHPEPQSFNHVLTQVAAEELRAQGHSVEISDLHAQGFHPAASREDFLSVHDASIFQYQAEQLAAAKAGTFCPEIAHEQERLKRADCIILQFPIWWGGAPAMLKGWFDRVAAYGVAYMDGMRFETGLFQGRRSLVSVTTGGTPHRFSDDGYYGPIEQVLKPVQQLFLGYLGFELTPPFVCYALARITDEERHACIEQWRQRVRELVATPVHAQPIPPIEELLRRVGDRDWRSRK